MTTTIEHLTDQCLLIILGNLSAAELLHVASVCKRWNELHTVACQQKTRLLISGFFEEENYYNFSLENDLMRFCDINYRNGSFDYNYFDFKEDGHIQEDADELEEVEEEEEDEGSEENGPICTKTDVYFISYKFPCVKQLVLFDCDISDQEYAFLLSTLLSITDLKLVITGKKQPTFNVHRVMNAVNRLPLLKSLYLYLGEMPLKLPLPILSRLEEFYFGFYDLDNYEQFYLFDILAKLSLEKIRKIGFGFFSDSENCNLSTMAVSLRELFKEKSALVERVTRVKIPASNSILPYLCDKFASISYFDVEFNNKMVLTHLAKLKLLEDLTLRTNTDPFDKSPIDDITEEEQVKELPTMDSVKKVVLLDFNFNDLAFKHVFPGAELVEHSRDPDYL